MLAYQSFLRFRMEVVLTYEQHYLFCSMHRRALKKFSDYEMILKSFHVCIKKHLLFIGRMTYQFQFLWHKECMLMKIVHLTFYLNFARQSSSVMFMI
jgi:hypothetical protein